MGDEILPQAENESPTETSNTEDSQPDEPTLSDIYLRLDRIETTLDGLRAGVNTVGEMMNSVAEMFSDMVQKVNQGGIGAILGNLMGRNNG